MSKTATPARVPCRLYLITPPHLPDLAGFADRLGEALDAGDVAALQIRLKDVSDDDIRRAVREALDELGDAVKLDERLRAADQGPGRRHIMASVAIFSFS